MKAAKNACPALDVAQTLRDIQSEDEETRARAVRLLCPCRSGWGPFEEHLPLISALTKDPSPRVRASALHLFEDAAEMENGGYPTNPREAADEMLRRRRESRFRPEPEDIEARRDERGRGRR